MIKSSHSFFHKICWCLDSNRGSLMLEVTALPTAPQPTTTHTFLGSNFWFVLSSQFCVVIRSFVVVGHNFFILSCCLQKARNKKICSWHWVTQSNIKNYSQSNISFLLPSFSSLSLSSPFIRKMNNSWENSAEISLWCGKF